MLEVKEELEYALGCFRKVYYWLGDYEPILSHAQRIIEEKEKQGINCEEERKLFIQFENEFQKRDKENDEIRAKFKREEFEGKTPSIPLPSNFKKKVKELLKMDTKVSSELSIRDCIKLKRQNPKLGLRALGKKFYRNKDTVNKWLSSEYDKKLDDWEKENKLLYQDKYELQFEEVVRRLAKSRGVRDEDYIKWVACWSIDQSFDDSPETM